MAGPRTLRAAFTLGLPGRAFAFCRPFGAVFLEFSKFFPGACPFWAFFCVL